MTRILPVQFAALPPGLTRLKGGVVIRRGVGRTSVYRETDIVRDGVRHCTRRKEGVAFDQASLEKLVLRIWSERGLLPRPTRLPTFAAAAEQYVALKMNTASALGPKDIEYGVSLAPWKHTPIDQISRSEIAAWYKANETSRPASAVRCVRVTRRILRWAIQYFDLNVSNPASAFRLSAKSEKTEPIPIDELPEFWQTIQKVSPFKFGFYALGVYTGGRRSSLLALRWPDVDLQHRTLTFRTMKGRAEPLVVPLSRQAGEVLASLPRTGPRVLPISKVTLPNGKSWSHRCRATFISAGVAAGVDRDLRKMLVGHEAGTDPHSGYIGRDFLQETLRPAAQKIGDWLEAKMLSTD
jgi:integrase